MRSRRDESATDEQQKVLLPVSSPLGKKATKPGALGQARTVRARRVGIHFFARSPRSRATCEPRRVRLTDPERDVWKRQGAPPASPGRHADGTRVVPA